MKKIHIWLKGSIYNTNFLSPTLRPWLCFRSNWSYVCCLFYLSCLDEGNEQKGFSFIKPSLKKVRFSVLWEPDYVLGRFSIESGLSRASVTTTSHHSYGKPILEFQAWLTWLMIWLENSPQPNFTITVFHASYVRVWLVFFFFLKQFGRINGVELKLFISLLWTFSSQNTT